MTHNQHLIDLLTGHLRGQLTPEHQEQLNLWISKSERNRLLFDSINDEDQLRELVLLYHQEESEDNEAIILHKIRQGMGGIIGRATVKELPVHSSWTWGWVAALVVVSAGVGGYFLLNRSNQATETVALTPQDIPPGKEGAILTLADGTEVVLDSLGNGVIASQNGAQVMLNNGSLAYSNEAAQTSSVYNQLSTPKGRQFKLVLPDGTKVWLNAASSLRYPTVFEGTQRSVEVTGEAFFEVAQKQNQPFNINVNNQAQIRVLGTQFNVNAYSNETTIKTTLIDGGIQIRPGAGYDPGSFVSLKPGQQAEIRPAGNKTNLQPVKVVSNANIEKVMAWKSGLFDFENASLEEVMRQVERWYDIEVVYEKGIPNLDFGGKMSNDVTLAGLLKSLEESDVHFRMEGRKLIVLP